MFCAWISLVFIHENVAGDAFNPNPCQHGGMCRHVSFLDSDFACDCTFQYVGIHCKVSVLVFYMGTCSALFDIFDSKYCHEGHCKNGGHCILNHTTCACPPGFSGPVCGHIQDRHCYNNPCIHGTCTSLNHSPHYQCTCKPGWLGYACHEPDVSKVDAGHCDHYYSKTTCHNSGVCANITTHPYFRCYCSYGYEGYRCEFNDDPCTPNPCLHRGTCHPSVSHGIPLPKCTCQKGYSGSKCQVMGDACNPNPCQHGGTCRHVSFLESDFACDCTSQYVGIHCEAHRNCIHGKPCANGGTCVWQTGAWVFVGTCHCPAGYSGDNCEVHNG